jgi:hypothetical protein
VSRLITATQQLSGTYLVTTARWPRGDRFTEDRAALYLNMRMRAEARYLFGQPGPISPYVTLSGCA